VYMRKGVKQIKNKIENKLSVDRLFIYTIKSNLTKISLNQNK